MICQRVGSTQCFARIVEVVAARDPVAHSVLTTSVRRVLRDHPDADVLWWVLEDGGRPLAVGQHFPPHGCGVHGMPDEAAAAAAGPLVDLLLAEQREVAGFSGPPEAATAAAAEWTARTGAGWRVSRELARWVLDHLRAPAAVSGSARPARPDEVDLAASWIRDFHAEVEIHDTVRREHIAAEIARGTLLVWADDADTPVSLGGWREPEGGVSRVGPVWTPPPLRGNGFGSAVTAAATGAALAAGARDVCLYTDLANPVSNAIYARIGYRRVGEEVEVTLVSR